MNIPHSAFRLMPYSFLAWRTSLAKFFTSQGKIKMSTPGLKEWKDWGDTVPCVNMHKLLKVSVSLIVLSDRRGSGSGSVVESQNPGDFWRTSWFSHQLHLLSMPRSPPNILSPQHTTDSSPCSSCTSYSSSQTRIWHADYDVMVHKEESAFIGSNWEPTF